MKTGCIITLFTLSVLLSFAQILICIFAWYKVYYSTDTSILDWKNLWYRTMYVFISFVTLIINGFLFCQTCFTIYKFIIKKHSIAFQNALIINVILFICLIGCNLKSVSVFSSYSLDFSKTCNQYASSDSRLILFYNLEPFLEDFDKILCSSRCPCDLTVSPSAFNSTGLVFDGNAKSIADCSNTVLAESLNRIITSYSSGWVNLGIAVETLFSYLSVVETRSNCAGFCTSYNFTKYLFTDINRGIPQTNGCLEAISDYNPHYVSSFTILSFISNGLFFLEIILQSFIVYLDLNYPIISEKDKGKNTKEMTPILETLGSQDTLNYEKSTETTNNTASVEEDENSSSESDEIEFDTDNINETTTRDKEKNRELELTDI